MEENSVERLPCPGEDPRCYGHEIDACLKMLNQMLADGCFSAGPDQMGMELELNLIDGNINPAMANVTMLELLDDPMFQAELGQHMIELNLPPRPLAGDATLELEKELRDILNRVDVAAHAVALGLIMIGMLPTLRADHFDRQWISPVPRYLQLNERIMATRSANTELDIEGIPLSVGTTERLRCASNSILSASACTSVQPHLKVAPNDFAAHWNAAQALAGAQVAIAANSPFLLGRALWHETRIPVFEQTIDTRSPVQRNTTVRPRVWFGQQWITSIVELFEENARYFTPLLPRPYTENPPALFEAGTAPSLAALRLHNSTVWRWNRPVYDVADGVPHLRIENRVLPAGPTVTDVLANTMFFFGALRRLAEDEHPIWSRMPFQVARDNFYAGARHGMEAQLYWPDLGRITPDQLVLHILLPLAHEGLKDYGMSPAAREHFLTVIEQRCVARRTGASWQRATVRSLADRGADRPRALATMLCGYLEHMHSNQPVHTWPIS
jgi:Glutamate-cysteine ligase family 2(GCS2)